MNLPLASLKAIGESIGSDCKQTLQHARTALVGNEQVQNTVKWSSGMASEVLRISDILEDIKKLTAFIEVPQVVTEHISTKFHDHKDSLSVSIKDIDRQSALARENLDKVYNYSKTQVFQHLASAKQILSMPIDVPSTSSELWTSTKQILAHETTKTVGKVIVVGGICYVVAPYVLSSIGFTPLGPALGSPAALWQSSIGNVQAGSVFAGMQSLGMRYGMAAAAEGMTMLACGGVLLWANERVADWQKAAKGMGLGGGEE